MPSFSLRNPHTIIVGALIIVILGFNAFARMPVDVFPDSEDSGGGRRHVLSRDAAARDGARHHDALRALLHPGQRHRAHRVALAARRQHHQGLLPARRSTSTRRRPRLGNLAMADLRHLPPGTLPPLVLPVGRLVVAGDAGDGLGQGLQPRPSCATRRSTTSATSSPRSPAPRCRRRLAASTARSWSTLNREALAGARADADGRGPRAQRRQPDHSGRRRQDRHAPTTSSTPTA